MSGTNVDFHQLHSRDCIICLPTQGQMKGESDGESKAARCVAVTSTPCGAIDWFMPSIICVRLRDGDGGVRADPMGVTAARCGGCTKTRNAASQRRALPAPSPSTKPEVWDACSCWFGSRGSSVVVVHLVRRACAFPGSARARWIGSVCLSSDESKRAAGCCTTSPGVGFSNTPC